MQLKASSEVKARNVFMPTVMVASTLHVCQERSSYGLYDMKCSTICGSAGTIPLQEFPTYCNVVSYMRDLPWVRIGLLA
jgi:hypothetical protein